MTSKLGYFILLLAMALSEAASAQSKSIYNGLRCHQFVKMFSSVLWGNSYGRYRLEDGQKMLNQQEILEHASPLFNTGTGGYKNVFSDGTSTIVWAMDFGGGEFTNNIYMLIDQKQPLSNKVTAYLYTTKGDSYLLELAPDEGVYEKDHNWKDHFIRDYSIKVSVGKDEAGNQLPPLNLYIEDNLKDTRYVRFSIIGTLQDLSRKDLKDYYAGYKPAKNFRKTLDPSVTALLDEAVSKEVSIIGNFVSHYDFDQKSLALFKREIAETMVVVPIIPEPSRNTLGRSPLKWLSTCDSVSGVASDPQTKTALDSIKNIFAK